MIPEILRHVVSHVVTRLFEGRLKKDALRPAAKDEVRMSDLDKP